MKNKLFLLIYTLVVFAFGSLVTFLLMTRSHMAQLAQLKAKTSTNIHDLATPLPHKSPQGENIEQASEQPLIIESLAIEHGLTQAQTTNQRNFSTQDFNEQSAKAVLNSISNRQLDAYVERFMTDKDAELIKDKRQFANRAIEELYRPNDNQPLTGQIIMSTSPNFTQQSINTNTLSKRQKLYAHLNTFGKVPLGANVFIKWTNRTTGEVLLFEKKLILPNSNTNWVSYQPYDSWQTGSYDVKFYQFTSELTPVAQLSYDVYQVID